MSRRSITLLAALVVALIVVGCGGDGEDETSTVQVTKAAFLKSADAICDKSYEEIESKFQSFVKDVGASKPFSDSEEIEEYVDTILVPAKQEEVEELRALGAPGGDEDAVDAIIEAHEEGIEVAEDDPREAVTSFGVFARATWLAEKYGLENCR